MHENKDSMSKTQLQVKKQGALEREELSIIIIDNFTIF